MCDWIRKGYVLWHYYFNFLGVFNDYIDLVRVVSDIYIVSQVNDQHVFTNICTGNEGVVNVKGKGTVNVLGH